MMATVGDKVDFSVRCPNGHMPHHVFERAGLATRLRVAALSGCRASRAIYIGMPVQMSASGLIACWISDGSKG